MSDKHFYPLTVSKVTKETPDAVSLTFDVPEALKETFSYKQGQYITLKFNLNGKEVRRAYSFSSSPVVDAKPTIAIKRVVKGLVSNHINDNVTAGTIIEVMPANGRFFSEMEETNRKNYYLFGGGSGITPMMSILKTVLETEPQSKVYLLYGNRDETSIIYKEEIAAICERYAGQIVVEHLLENPPFVKEKAFMGMFSKKRITWDGHVGRVTEKLIVDFLKKHPTNGRDAEYFICGPAPMMKITKACLDKQSLDKKKVHQELFSSLNLPHDKPAVPVNGAAKMVVVHLEGERLDIEVSPKDTILDVLLHKEYDAPYSCTSGACATCMAKVISGKVEMDTCYGIDEDEVNQGFILTCQAHPMTDDVEITFEVD